MENINIEDVEQGGQADAGDDISMSRRDFLGGAAATFSGVTNAGIVGGPIVASIAGGYMNSKEYEELEGDLESFGSRVSFHINRFHSADNYEFLKKNATTQMADLGAGGMLRAEYVRFFFTNEGPISSYNLTPNLRNGLGIMAVGICAQESKYDLTATNSDSGAYGPWQMMPMYIDDFNQNVNPRRKRLGLQYIEGEDVKVEDMDDLVLSTKVALMSFEIAYDRLKDSIDGMCVAFDVKGVEKDKLAVLLLVNAHNAGVGRIKEVIAAFIEQYEKDKRNWRLGNGDAETLFHHMSVLMMNKVGGYGRESSAYVAACMAGQYVVGKML